MFKPRWARYRRRRVAAKTRWAAQVATNQATAEELREAEQANSERHQMPEMQVADGDTVRPDRRAVHPMPPQAGRGDPGPPAGGANDADRRGARQPGLTR